MLDPQTETLLNLYVDGELPLDRQGELHARLAECRAARAQFNALMAFRLATRVDVNSVSPSADEALFSRIDSIRANQHVTRRAEDRPTRRGLRRVTVGAALAVAVLVVVVQAVVPAPAPIEVVDTVEVVPSRMPDAHYVVYPGIVVEDESLEEAP